ncbi:MAG TPA: 3-deoxy-D-manno-octulosonic acid kinase [Steroidobacteraceae bacterium]
MKGWAVGAEARLIPIRGGAMLYDSSRAGNAEPGWLEADWWRQRGDVSAAPEGRGDAKFIAADGRQLVLRHYRRGGLIAHISADRFLWRGPFRTRSLAEWQLLYRLRRAGLPVPLPIAAGYRREGLTYSANLLTEQLCGVQSLAALLRAAPVPITTWIAIGRCVRRFHDQGVCHADLNAHNILLGADEQPWLIDFDRGSLRAPGWWRDANLARLHRSLVKVSAMLPAERFGTADWLSLLDGYFAGAPAVAGPAASAC